MNELARKAALAEVKVGKQRASSVMLWIKDVDTENKRD